MGSLVSSLRRTGTAGTAAEAEAEATLRIEESQNPGEDDGHVQDTEVDAAVAMEEYNEHEHKTSNRTDEDPAMAFEACSGQNAGVEEGNEVHEQNKSCLPSWRSQPLCEEQLSSNSNKRTRISSELLPAESHKRSRMAQDVKDKYSSPLENIGDQRNESMVVNSSEDATNQPGSLSHALYTMVSEAGDMGLTVREARRKISEQGLMELLGEQDVRVSLQVARAMKKNPYFIEAAGGRFILWNTFLKKEDTEKAASNGMQKKICPPTETYMTTRSMRKCSQMTECVTKSSMHCQKKSSSEGKCQQKGCVACTYPLRCRNQRPRRRSDQGCATLKRVL